MRRPGPAHPRANLCSRLATLLATRCAELPRVRFWDFCESIEWYDDAFARLSVSIAEELTMSEAMVW